MKRLIVSLTLTFVLSSCTLFHPIVVWDAEQQSYVNSKWYDNQLSVIEIIPAEDGYMKLSLSEDEARKAGVSKRIYKTMQHQVVQLNAFIEEKGIASADTTGLKIGPPVVQ